MGNYKIRFHNGKNIKVDCKPETRYLTRMLRTLTTEELQMLNLLENRGSLSDSMLAKELDITEAAAQSLRQKLENEQIILKYRAIINWEKIESPEVIAVIQVNVTPRKGQGYDEVAHKVSAFEEVKTCLLVSGSFDLLVEVQGPSLKDVAFFVSDKLATIDGVEHTRTNFLLKRYKQAGDLFTGTGKTHRLPMVI